MQKFQDAWIEPYAKTKEKVAVFCDDGKSSFPALASFESFKKWNPDWDTAVLCTKDALATWVNRADEVFLVRGPGGFLGPKQYIYSAPKILRPRTIIAYLDLDLIHVAPLPDISAGLHSLHAAPDVSARGQTFGYSLTNEKDGIYHSTKREAQELLSLAEIYRLDLTQPTINTGVVIAAWNVAEKVATILRTLNQEGQRNQVLWRWLRSDRKKYFTRHREQGVFQFLAQAAMNTDEKLCVMDPTMNWQLIDPRNHNLVLGQRAVYISNGQERVSILHFNGFANPKGPARAFARQYMPNLLK